VSSSLQLPIIQRAELQGFSLYSQVNRISMTFPGGVFCLAGANGLGKSTFLSALSLGLTGVVPPTTVKYKSLAQYHARAIAYSRTYFEGRINEENHNSAEISLDVLTAGNLYSLTRNPFEPTALRSLTINGVPSDATTDEQRHEEFTQRITADCGLATFAQLVFIHHFLLSFDERRATLFWDTDSAEKILYLTLGMDPALADRADELLQIREAQDSLARNAQYDATTARGRLEEITATAKAALSPADVDRYSAYERLLEQREELVTELEGSLDVLTEARLQLAEDSARELAARQAYEDLLDSRLSARPSAERHPIILELLSSSTCPLSGHSGPSVLSAVELALKSGKCPLCGQSLDLHSNLSSSDSTDALFAADEQLMRARAELQVSRERLDRVQKRSSAIEPRLVDVDKQIAALEQDARVTRLLSTRGDVKAGLESIQSQYRATVDDALERKAEHLAKRDTADAQLKPIRAQLFSAFERAERSLVPQFQALASDFLGLPVDVSLAGSGSSHLRLLLTVRNSLRRDSNQLSESQRYFVDIALRMALVMHVSGDRNPVPLYIDTPEGSLDIAYESRAGAMFAAFAKSGHPLVMTANINTSQLLLRMAEECGREHMSLVRMTDWTTLSDVQAEEEGRIRSAYAAVELALTSGSASGRAPRSIPRADAEGAAR
jgi:DNA repair exonuclease SbcCD ATPase subunit